MVKLVKLFIFNYYVFVADPCERSVLPFGPEDQASDSARLIRWQGLAINNFSFFCFAKIKTLKTFCRKTFCLALPLRFSKYWDFAKIGDYSNSYILPKIPILREILKNK